MLCLMQVRKAAYLLQKNHSVCYKNGKQYKNLLVPHNIVLALIQMKALNYHMQWNTPYIH